MARVLQDLEPALEGRPAAERVGDVGQAVLVEGAGDEQPDGHRDHRRDRGRHELAEAGCDAADERADQRPDERQPHDDAVVSAAAARRTGNRVRNWTAPKNPSCP